VKINKSYNWRTPKLLVALKNFPRTATEVHPKFYGNCDDQCFTKLRNIVDILFLERYPLDAKIYLLL